MKQTLDDFISNNKNGMILLDSPTGFGKTYNVVQIMKEFIQGTSHQKLERIFFVTNLKTNLPYEDLDKLLSEEEKKKYFVAKSYEENIFDKWKYLNKNSLPDEVKFSKEFKNLDGDLEILLSLDNNENKIENKSKAINSFHNKIATISEPAFREFLRKTYFLCRLHPCTSRCQKIWIKSFRSAEWRTFGKYFEYFCMDDGSKFYILFVILKNIK